MKIQNPILRGFNPDPSIIRVGDDYYIATSTFEWFPGVQIHHSRDLVHWRLAARPLTRKTQLDMTGAISSCGVWAPCLSYDEGTFYLAYTDVKTKSGIFRDMHNYLVTTDDILGEWSEPVYLNSGGFDPSLFHDDDGRKWLLNTIHDHRKGRNSFAGILLQEYSPEQKRLVGPVYNIFKGTKLGFTEGPHLYKRGGYYYLLTAEGGTGYGHAVTIARSKNITGPYEVDPTNPILTSRSNPDLQLQRAGHADLVETQTGEWYMVHLCSRPLQDQEGNNRSVLGRETAIQKVIWTEDGWLRMASGNNEPEEKVDAPNLSLHPWDPEPIRDDFDSPNLNIHFQTLRVPLGEDTISLTDRPGFLRLKGRESLSSQYDQALVARRLQAFTCTASTCVEFEPESFQQMAGLVCLYDNSNFYYLRISWDEQLGKCLNIITCQSGKFDEALDQDITIDGWEQVYLRVDVDHEILQFFYSADGESWKPIGPKLDAAILSDEHCRGFTGAFVGLCCQDFSGQRRSADFDFFAYQERD